MQLSEQPSKVPLAFAENGEKEVIPEGSSPFDGRASLNDGFPPLTRQALVDGGIPPSGLDMNGILNLATAINRWQSAGGFFAYDDDFATDSNVDGYPKGAMLVRADGTGFWVSLVDDNDTDPEGGSLNWQPVNNIGIHPVTMTGSNVTLTTLESARDLIVISGTLTANVSLIFPVTVKQWLVANNTTGAYTITCKTASGTGGVVQQGTSRVFYGDGTNLYGINALASSQAQVDAGTDAFTFLTPKTFKDSTLRAVKASQAEVNAGTDDAKFVTPSTFANASKWGDKADKNGNASNTFAVAYAVSANQAVPKAQFDEKTGLASTTTDGIVRKATLAQLISAAMNVWPDASTILDGMEVSLGTNGYVKFPKWFDDSGNRLIVQWGAGVAASGATITFPTPFLNNLYIVTGSDAGNASSGFGTAARALNGFVLATDALPSLTYNYFAIGD